MLRLGSFLREFEKGIDTRGLVGFEVFYTVKFVIRSVVSFTFALVVVMYIKFEQIRSLMSGLLKSD